MTTGSTRQSHGINAPRNALTKCTRAHDTEVAALDWQPCNRALTMQEFFFDMKDGVSMRDRIGIEFNTNAEAIRHGKEIAQDFRDNSLRDDQDLEILVVNESGKRFIASFSPRTGIRRRTDCPCPLKQSGPMMMNNSTLEFERLLGKAALALWPDLPRDVQENLFETAVAGDNIMRSHLASVPARPPSENGSSGKADTVCLELRGRHGPLDGHNRHVGRERLN